MQVLWFKRDLQVADHAALRCVLQCGRPVLPLHIVEPGLWAQPDLSGRHYAFLRECLADLDQQLRLLGSSLVVRACVPCSFPLPSITSGSIGRAPALHLAHLFTDYEPGIHYGQVQMRSGTTGINAVRVYNPIKQSLDQDPEGAFIRCWVPKLCDMPSGLIHTPWFAPDKIGGYPKPLVEKNRPEPRP